MVECERCHKKFVSYAAFSQHFDSKHHNAQRPAELEKELAAEKELSSYKAVVHYARGPSKATLAVFLLILIVASGVIGYLAFTPREQSTQSTIVGGASAPDFTLPGVNGASLTLSSYRGKANVLLFFNEGLACAPCLTQMTELDQLEPQFSNLNIVVVSITGDQLNLLSDWAHSSGPQYGKVLSDRSLAVSRAYDMLGPDKSMMPGSAPGHSFVLVSEQGKIIWRQDYGPYQMSIPNNEILAAVKHALGA